MYVLRHALRNYIARQAAPKRGYHGGHGKQPTMNDLPVPEGDFYKLHAERQAKHNKVLIGGTLTLIGTCFFAKETGLLHFNFSPPKTYE